MDGYEAKLPPSDQGAEEAVISCMMINQGAAVRGLNMLQTSDFYHRATALIFVAIKQIIAEGREPDTINVRLHMTQTGTLGEAGGTIDLIRISELMVSAGNLTHYGEIIKNLSQHRKNILLCRGMLNSSYEAVDPAGELAGDMVRRLVRADERVNKLGDKLSFDDDLKTIDDWQHGVGRPSALPFGFASLDRIVSGMMPGELSLVAARTGVGKTSFGTQTVLQCARDGHKLAVFSLEMTSQQLRHRMLSQLSGIPEYVFAKRDMVTPMDWERLKKIAASIMQRDIWITDEPSLTTSQIRLRIQQAFIKEPPAIILIDHLQKIKPFDARASLYEKSGMIASDLKNIAKEFGCAILGLTQFGRQADKSERPKLSDIRESGKIEEEAALVVAIHRKTIEEGGMNDFGDFVVLKSRYSGLGVAPFRFKGDTFRFDEVTRHEEEQPPEMQDQLKGIN